MNAGGLHRWWARHGGRLVLVVLAVSALTQAYMMWRQLPADPSPIRTGI